MYRLLLNGESHMEERIKSLTDLTFASNVFSEEKKNELKRYYVLYGIIK